MKNSTPGVPPKRQPCGIHLHNCSSSHLRCQTFPLGTRECESFLFGQQGSGMVPSSPFSSADITAPAAGLEFQVKRSKAVKEHGTKGPGSGAGSNSRSATQPWRDKRGQTLGSSSGLPDCLHTQMAWWERSYLCAVRKEWGKDPSVKPSPAFTRSLVILRDRKPDWNGLAKRGIQCLPTERSPGPAGLRGWVVSPGPILQALGPAFCCAQRSWASLTAQGPEGCPQRWACIPCHQVQWGTRILLSHRSPTP